MKPVLRDRNQVVLGQRFSTRSDVPQVRMQPVIDVAFKRHDAAGEAENRQENPGGEAQVQMDRQDDLPCGQRWHLLTIDDVAGRCVQRQREIAAI